MASSVLSTFAQNSVTIFVRFFSKMRSNSLILAFKAALLHLHLAVTSPVVNVESIQILFTVFFKDSISVTWAAMVSSIFCIQSPSLASPGVGDLSGGEPVDSVLPRFAPSLLPLFLDAIFVRKIQIFTPLHGTPPIQALLLGPCWKVWVGTAAGPDMTAYLHRHVDTGPPPFCLFPYRNSLSCSLEGIKAIF